jgi:hypothetical protein
LVAVSVVAGNVFIGKLGGFGLPLKKVRIVYK